MFTVWKATLQITDLQIVSVPRDAEMLYVAMDYTTPPTPSQPISVWYKVDTDNPMTQRRLAILGTGNEIAEVYGSYVGTAINETQGLVWHVFDRGDVV